MKPAYHPSAFIHPFSENFHHPHRNTNKEKVLSISVRETSPPSSFYDYLLPIFHSLHSFTLSSFFPLTRLPTRCHHLCLVQHSQHFPPRPSISTRSTNTRHDNGVSFQGQRSTFEYELFSRRLFAHRLISRRLFLGATRREKETGRASNPTTTSLIGSCRSHIGKAEGTQQQPFTVARTSSAFECYEISRPSDASIQGTPATTNTLG